MPKLLHVITTKRGVGGAEVVLAALARGAHEAGWDQIVLNPLADDDVDLGRLCAPVPVLVRVGRRPRDVFGARRWLARQIELFDPDIVHVHLIHALLLVGTLRKGQRRWVLSHQHGGHLAVLGRRLEAHLEGLVAPRFDRVVAISRSVQDFLTSGYGYKDSQVVLIQNGWEGEPLPRRPSPKARIVCVANFRPEKAHDVLLRAFAALRTIVPEARLVLVGDGPLRTSVQRQAERLGVGDAVEMPGSVADVWPHLAEAHLFALPSRSEPLGVAAMEAMAAGLPVVATRVGGLQELVEHELSGLLVQPDDVDGLTAALVRVLTEPGLSQRMSRRAYELADGMQMTAMTEQYLALYRQMLPAPHQGRE